MNMNELPSRQEVVSELIQRWTPTIGEEIVSLEAAAGRVLKDGLRSKHALPVFRSAGPDGIAVKYTDFEQGMPDLTGWKKGINYCMADTGDDFEDPFDSVIRIEEVTFPEQGGIELSLSRPLEKGQNVSVRGSKLEEDEVLLQAGTILTPLHLNLLASGGYDQVTVVKRPKVIYIPTGSELIPPGTPPARGENVESNGLMVEAMLQSWGAEVVRDPICRDIKADLEARLDDARKEGDIVLINGGSSKGSEDYNTALIRQRSTWFQHGVRSVPGFPVGLGLVNQTPVINMPGPPMAAFSVLHWCVQALVYHGMGIPMPLSRTTTAVLQADLKAPEKLDFYQRMQLQQVDGQLTAMPLSFKDRMAESMALCNGLFVVPAGSNYQKGDTITVEWLI